MSTPELDCRWLSKIKMPIRYAACAKCKEIFVNDTGIVSIRCPNDCGSELAAWFKTYKDAETWMTHHQREGIRGDLKDNEQT